MLLQACGYSSESGVDDTSDSSDDSEAAQDWAHAHSAAQVTAFLRRTPPFNQLEETELGELTRARPTAQHSAAPAQHSAAQCSVAQRSTAQRSATQRNAG